VTNIELYLGLGSNQGERASYLTQAVELLTKRVGEYVRSSAVYESEPWGFACDTPFLNQVVVVRTSLAPKDILREIEAIERDLGRIRSSTQRYTPRTIDIDILLYGESVIDVPPSLVVPHPHIVERRFVLVPLVEVAPTGSHPLIGTTWSDLLTTCCDTGWVRKYEGARGER